VYPSWSACSVWTTPARTSGKASPGGLNRFSRVAEDSSPRRWIDATYPLAKLQSASPPAALTIKKFRRVLANIAVQSFHSWFGPPGSAHKSPASNRSIQVKKGPN
jgi:hypothetical protein